LVSFVEPQTGPATDFDLYVRSVLPSGTGFNSGAISTINLTGTEKYFIYWMHNSFTNFFFNSSLLVAGQHVSIGGPFSSGQVTVKRVVLRHEGHSGSWVVGSTDTGAHTFKFNSNGLAGGLFYGPGTLFLTPFPPFRGGPAGLGGLTAANPLPASRGGLWPKSPT